ncbi:hypothetical protein NEOLEDRAFT_1242384 [Neolentinus lepideus HHB14362 ss-1]|uniref:Uncharacterized protein n=1 Tax=Neolentinus lepideus HHB14362 ss-1 TaxID=1314782 RepID=A0A165RYL9_9AGAM|nr:hypothetical protein NEOLEDRAFT_1242384 [Neolentinus lepideus HHB14362 ss-1]
MFLHSGLATIVLVTSWLPLFTGASVLEPRSLAYTRYTTPHSLGDNYVFDARDGWQTTNVTDMQYKYSRSSVSHGNESLVDSSGLEKRASKAKSSKKATSSTKSKLKTLALSKANILTGASVVHALDSVWNSLKGIGKAEDVTITWYTGHDLENPSCWASGNWAPTDNSFACALTLDGWTSKPQCFKFLELCKDSKTCVFVRVVDTCAGCAPGSKHVDLTKAAFSNLADINEGILSVHMRPATDPSPHWFEELWGPKA